MQTTKIYQTETQLKSVFINLIAKHPAEQIYFDSDLETFVQAVNQIQTTGDFDRDFIPQYIEEWLIEYKNFIPNNNVA